MDKEDLLDSEKVEKRLSPHPLSFMKFQSLCIFLIVWGAVLGWLANFSEYTVYFSTFWSVIVAWIIVLLIVGVFASLITIRWSILIMYMGIVALGVGLMFWQGGWLNDSKIFLPIYTVIISVLGFLTASGCLKIAFFHYNLIITNFCYWVNSVPVVITKS